MEQQLLFIGTSTQQTITHTHTHWYILKLVQFWLALFELYLKRRRASHLGNWFALLWLDRQLSRRHCSVAHWALGEGDRRATMYIYPYACAHTGALAHRPYAALMTWQFHGLHKKNDLWLWFDTESRLMKCVTRFVLNT